MDYEKELYKPLLNSKLTSEYRFILPHSREYDKVNTKEILINSDYLVAEVSFPATGVGLELGRAECNNVSIICFVKKGKKCSSSIERNFEVFEYNDSQEMIKKLEERLNGK